MLNCFFVKRLLKSSVYVNTFYQSQRLYSFELYLYERQIRRHMTESGRGVFLSGTQAFERSKSRRGAAAQIRTDTYGIQQASGNYAVYLCLNNAL
jgi:hypothetical protein